MELSTDARGERSAEPVVEVPPPGLLQRCGAEAVATFFLVFVGVGAIAVDAAGGGVGHVGISLAFALVVCVMVYATGHVSGAHLNPAVTVAFTVGGHFPAREAPAYVGAQLLGATIAAGLLAWVVGLPGAVGVTQTTLPASGAFAVEFVLTFGLMFVICGVATDVRAAPGVAGVAIGGAVGMGALFGGPLTGASMNPARSWGPALVTGVWVDHWLYWTAPVAGAVAAALTYAWVSRAGRRGDAGPGPGSSGG